LKIILTYFNEYGKIKKEVKMRKINDFFEILSERLWDENYLSDVTYSLLKSDSNFKDIFFEYCYGEKNNDIEIIEREHREGKSRPDFYFKDIQNDKEYILEIKIYDKNIHPEYKEKFKKTKLSFIANYEAKGEPYHAEQIYSYVNTWYKFIPYLQNRIKNIPNNDLIKGYIIYLKKLTNFLEAKSMNLKNTKSLIDFNTLLEKIVKEFPNNSLSINNSKKSYGVDFSGKYCKYKKQKKEIEFWIGVYFDNPEWDPLVCIEYENFKGNSKGKYYYTEENDDPWLYLNDDLNKRFNNNNEKIEDQENILLNYLKEFISTL
jgi:hypothetical protein